MSTNYGYLNLTVKGKPDELRAFQDYLRVHMRKEDWELLCMKYFLNYLDESLPATKRQTMSTGMQFLDYVGNAMKVIRDAVAAMPEVNVKLSGKLANSVTDIYMRQTWTSPIGYSRFRLGSMMVYDIFSE